MVAFVDQKFDGYILKISQLLSNFVTKSVKCSLLSTENTVLEAPLETGS